MKLLDEEVKIEYQPIIDRILSGEKVGKRYHYCSPFVEFDYTEWEELGWDSPEEFITNTGNPDWFTFDEQIIDRDNKTIDG